MTFLNRTLRHGVPIPPLEVEVDPMVGPYQRSFVAEPLESPVPEPETIEVHVGGPA